MDKQDLAHAILKAKKEPCHPEWNRHCYNLARDLLQNDPNNFMDFQAIKETMFVGNAEYTFEQFKDLQSTISITELVDCDTFSQNHQHPIHATTGNTIHHRYHLWQLAQHGKCKAENCSSILELGGGYGNMARLISKMGFEEKYYISDLPEFSLLQQYYLDYHGVPASWDVDLHKHYDLFIATWSLSEIPLEDRAPYEHLDVDNFLIAYGPKYCNINNTEYFRYFQTQYTNHTWDHFEAPYQPDQYYLIGSKK